MFLLFTLIFFIHLIIVILPPLYIFGFFGLFEIIIFSLILAYFIKYRELEIRKRGFKLLGSLYLMEIVANTLNSILILILTDDFSYDNILKAFSFNFVFGSVILIVLPIFIIFIFSKMNDSFYYKIKNKRYLFVEIITLSVISLMLFTTYLKQLEFKEDDKKDVLIQKTIEKNIFKSSQNSQIVDTTLKFRVWEYIAKYSKNQNEDVRFYLTYYDLDRDGKDEAFIYLDSDGFCSNGSCRVVVFYLSVNKGFKEETPNWFVSAMLPMAKKELFIDTNTTLVKEDWEFIYGDIYTEISRQNKPDKKYLHYIHHLGESKMARYLKHNTKEFNEFETKIKSDIYFHKLEFKNYDHIDLSTYYHF